MTDTELADLLHRASRGAGDGARLDTGALITRARRTRRRHQLTGLCALVTIVLLGAALVPQLDRDDRGVEVAAGEAEEVFPRGWSRLPDPPLTPRSGATAVWTGREIVVAGGHVEPCAPPSEEGCRGIVPLADGAAFDVSSRTWRSIAPSPVAFSNRLPATALDGDFLLITPCPLTECRADAAMLRYRPADDAWDMLPAPPGSPGGHRLVAAGDELVAYGAGPDGRSRLWQFDPASSTWTDLPDEPSIAHLIQPQVMSWKGEVLVFGTDFSARRSIVGARLANKTWTPIAGAAGDGVLPDVVENSVVVVPSHGLAGGILDIGMPEWRPLPPAPASSPLLGPRVAGAIGVGSSTFQSTAGHVLDMTTSQWIQLPPIDDRTTDISITSFGRRLFSYGGKQPPGGRAAELLGDAWVWTPPGPSSPPAPSASAPPPTAASTPSVGPAVSAVPLPLPPVPPPTPGAPQFVSASGDASKGQVTVKFDRPVTGDKPNYPPGGGTIPQDKTSPMSLIVFGADERCSGPDGNAHEYLAGVGTDTITTDATSLAAGTTYIGIGRQFVKSVADGTYNDSVVVKGVPPTADFTGMSCIPIPVSGAVPAPTTTTEAPNAPELLSATGDARAGRVTLKFNRPVVPGDGPGGNAAPSMNAMGLVVHMTDSTCSNPNGNAHEYLSGVGTDTLVTDATSLVVGTTYISIYSGFAKGAADGVAMRNVRCLAMPVTG